MSEATRIREKVRTGKCSRNSGPEHEESIQTGPASPRALRSQAVRRRLLDGDRGWLHERRTQF